MVTSITDLEEAAALGWRAPEEDRLGRWLLRAADGFTGRANSALPLGEPGLPLAAATGWVRRWYTARDLPALIAVPYPVGRPEASELDRFLAGQGWTVRPGTVTVMTARAEGVARRSPAAPVPVHVAAEPDDAWLARYHFMGQPDLPPSGRQLLVSAPWQAFGSVWADGQAVAIGRIAVAAGWAGLTAIEVDPRLPAPRAGYRAHRPAGHAGRGPGCRRPVPSGRRRQRRSPPALPAGRLRRPPRLPLPGRAGG